MRGRRGAGLGFKVALMSSTTHFDIAANDPSVRVVAKRRFYTASASNSTMLQTGSTDESSNSNTNKDKNTRSRSVQERTHRRRRAADADEDGDYFELKIFSTTEVQHQPSTIATTAANDRVRQQQVLGTRLNERDPKKQKVEIASYETTLSNEQCQARMEERHELIRPNCKASGYPTSDQQRPIRLLESNSDNRTKNEFIKGWCIDVAYNSCADHISPETSSESTKIRENISKGLYASLGPEWLQPDQSVIDSLIAYRNSRGQRIFIALAVAIAVALAALCFILVKQYILDEEKPAIIFTKFPSKKSQEISAADGTLRLEYDYTDYSILLSKQYYRNRSQIETIFFDEHLHNNSIISTFVRTNETCAQVSSEIVCCETFCEGKLNDGHIIRRDFKRQFQFCGAWHYAFDATYICTRKRGRIVITEFWSMKEYCSRKAFLSATDFQAIHYLPNHNGVILTKNSKKSDKICLINFKEKNKTCLINFEEEEKTCHDIGFLKLKSVDNTTKRSIIDLQNSTWAIVTSKVVESSLQWSIVVFNEKQMIFKDEDNQLFSVDHELIAYGESPFVTVCTLEKLVDSGEKVLSCTDYKFNA